MSSKRHAMNINSKKGALWDYLEFDRKQLHIVKIVRFELCVKSTNRKIS